MDDGFLKSSFDSAVMSAGKTAVDFVVAPQQTFGRLQRTLGG